MARLARLLSNSILRLIWLIYQFQLGEKTTNNIFKKFLAFLVTACLTLALAVIVANTSQPKNVRAASIAVQQNNPDTNTTVPPAINNIQPQKYPISKEVKGVNISLLSVELADNTLYAVICFDFPSNNSLWELGDPNTLKLSNGVTEIGVYSLDLLPDPATGNLKKDDKGNYIGRCDRVGFPIDPGFSLENLTISVSGLSTGVPDQIDCNKAQAKLDEKKSGIKINCLHGQGQGGYEITENSQGLETSEAHRMVLDAIKEKFEGTWIFEVTLP